MQGERLAQPHDLIELGVGESERERFLGIYPMELGLQLLYETDARIELGPARADPRQEKR